MSFIKGIIRGNLGNVKEQTIDANKLYAVKDLPDNSITNMQMQNALDDSAVAAFLKVNNTYVCIDDGDYIKNHIYRWTGNFWEDLTPISLKNSGLGNKYLADDGSYKSIEIEDIKIDDTTISRNSEDQLQAIALIHRDGHLDGNTINSAIKFTRYDNE